MHRTLISRFEVAVEKILQATGKSKDSLTGGQATGLNLTAGLIAGMAAAVISQPADTLLSKINKTKGLPGQSTTSRLISMAGQLGAAGLFTGMGARLVMIGTLTAGQCESNPLLFLSHIFPPISFPLRRSLPHPSPLFPTPLYAFPCPPPPFLCMANSPVFIYGDIKRMLNATGGVEIAAVPK